MKKDPKEMLSEKIRILPPFESQVAILTAQRNKWKLLAASSVLFSTVAAISFAVLLRHKLFEKMNSEYIVVPGAAEFLRVRPNLIPDSVVFDFAEFISTYAGNFTYRNAKDHFATVAERMAPELKGRFLRDADSKFSEWSKRRVDQVFAFDPVRRFDVVIDKFGSKYVLVVKGNRTQYADGTKLLETDENLYLELRPRTTLAAGTRADESLLLIERLDWVTSSQAETLLATRTKPLSEKAQ